MQQITTKLPENVVESLDHVAAEQYGGNRSEAIRELVTNALNDDSDERQKELCERIEDLERERDQLREQLAATNRRVDEHKELVRYAQSERSLSEQRAQAGVFTRAKWWLIGMPGTEESDDR